MKPTEAEFLKCVENHQLTILRDDGLYRHLRFRAPGTSIEGFDIVTWPGYLCYCGDMGEYVFQRLDDMLQFFRTDHGINPQYWSEKVVAEDRDGVMRYDADRAVDVIAEWLRNSEATRGVVDAVNDDLLCYAYDGEDALRQAVDDFELDGFRFENFAEADLREYTYRFIFCCYALVWGIRKYDEVKA